MRLLLEVFLLKNMFFVINKEKVYAYVVSILTIVTLFFMSHVLNTDITGSQETSANTVNEQNLNYNINSNIGVNENTDISENKSYN